MNIKGTYCSDYVYYGFIFFNHSVTLASFCLFIVSSPYAERNYFNKNDTFYPVHVFK